MEFQERLQQKQRDAATRALLDAIVEDPTQSISAVMSSLEEDAEASYFSEVFKELSLGQIWVATLRALLQGRISTEALSESVGDDGDLEQMLVTLNSGILRGADARSNGEDVSPLEMGIISAFADSEAGDGEGENEYADASDDVEDEAPAKPRKRKAKGKGKGKGKAKAKGKGKSKGKKKAPPKAAAAADGDALDLSDPKIGKAYRKSIMDYLKQNKCLDFDSGAPAQKIREVVGGSPKQLRDELAGLIGDEKITYDGKARGTKYFLL